MRASSSRSGKDNRLDSDGSFARNAGVKGTKTMLGVKEIEEIIPQRPPFLFVDQIEELEPGVRAVGYKMVTMNEPFFLGHFPEEPIMPGVLIIESLAQTGAVAILSMEENKGKNAFFGGVNRAKFRRKVVPGDRLRLECEIVKNKGPMGVGKCTATVDGELAAECELVFALSFMKENG